MTEYDIRNPDLTDDESRLLDEAEQLYDSGNLKKSKEMFELLLNKHGSSVSIPALRIKLNLAGCCYYLDDTPRAEELFQQVVESTRNNSRNKERRGYFAQSLYYLALIKYDQHLFTDTLALLNEIDECRDSWPDLDHGYWVVEVSLLHGRALRQLRKHDLAYRVLKETSTRLLTEDEQKKYTALLAFEIGMTLVDANRFEEAAPYLNDLIPSDAGDEINMIAYHNMMMRLHLALGAFDQVIVHFEASSDLEMPDEYKANIDSMAGRAYFFLKEWDASLGCLLASQTLAKDKILRNGNDEFLEKLRQK